MRVQFPCNWSFFLCVFHLHPESTYLYTRIYICRKYTMGSLRKVLFLISVYSYSLSVCLFHCRIFIVLALGPYQLLTATHCRAIVLWLYMLLFSFQPTRWGSTVQLYIMLKIRNLLHCFIDTSQLFQISIFLCFA